MAIAERRPGRLPTTLLLPCLVLFMFGSNSGLAAAPVRLTYAAVADSSRGVEPGETLPSYWGPIPLRCDSTMAVFVHDEKSMARKTFGLPWSTVRIPFRASTKLIKTAIIFEDERGMSRQINRLIGPMTGPFGIKLRPMANGEDGLGFGIDATHHAFIAPDNRMRLIGKISLNGSSRATLGLHFAEDDARSYLFSTGYTLLTAAHFHGLGPLSGSDESYFSRETAWAGAGLRHELSPGLSAVLSAAFSVVGARGPGHSDADDPALSEVFALPPPGYGERSGGLTAKLALLHDTTDEDGRPSRGGLRSFSVSRFRKTEGCGDDFFTFSGEVEQFFSLWKSGQTLALRAFGQWIEAENVHALPFQRLLSNDGPYTMRGYHNLRWRDRALGVISCEYRWALWANKFADRLGVDLYLFSDLGQVFTHLEQIDLDRLRFSYGGGWRLIGNDGFAGRLEWGRGHDDTVWRLALSQTFQPAKGGVLHGFSQTILR